VLKRLGEAKQMGLGKRGWFIPNFGERRRQGETTSAAFVESTIKSGQQTIRQKTADAMGAARGSSFAAD